jgi:hypothetical protein
MKDEVRPRFRPAGHAPHPLLDRLGATGSLVCAVHCALLPLLIALLPSFGIAAWLGEDFERGFVTFATLLGVFTLAWGYRRHREVRALGLLLPGLGALWLGVLYAPLHHASIPHAVTMTIGGALVGMAHLANLRLNNRIARRDGHVHSATCGHGMLARLR